MFFFAPIIHPAILGAHETHAERQTLSNGSTFIFEPMESRYTTLTLVLNSPPSDGLNWNGAKHLLEHILALSNEPNLDYNLESHGGFLTAETTRYAVKFEVQVPRGLESYGIDVLKKVLATQITNSALAHEQREIALEQLALPESELISSAVGKQLHGKEFGDPEGDLTAIGATALADLQKAAQVITAPSRVALVIQSPDISSDTKTLAESMLGGLSAQATGAHTNNLPQSLTSPEAGDESVPGIGMGIGISAEGIMDPKTQGQIAAGLLIAAHEFGSFFDYEPSNQVSCMVLGNTSDPTQFATYCRSVVPENLITYLPLAQSLFDEWWSSSVQHNPVVTVLLNQFVDSPPKIQKADLLNGFKAWLSKDAVTVIGRGQN